MPNKNHAGVGECLHRHVLCVVRTLALAGALASGLAAAQPSPPWTPDAAGRHDLVLLVDEAGLDLPVSQWPLPRAAVMRALDALPTALPDPLDAARDRVRAQLRASEQSGVHVTLRGRDESLSGFGGDATPGSSIGVRSGTLATPQLALQLGARIDTELRPGRGSHRLRLDDTALAVEALGVQLHVGAHRSWWSPGWQSSLLLGNNAPAMNSIGVQRASASRSASPWAAWMGPWNFEFFVAKTDDALRSYVVGQRLTLRPWPALEIGLSRTAQWGGRGRSHSARSFMRMMLGVGVNIDSEQHRPHDPAGMMAGFDLRLRCPFRLRCAAYTQLIGEDEAGMLPAKYLGLHGLESWSADGRSRYFAEVALTTCGAALGKTHTRPCAYRNSAYPDGYTHAGRWLGAAIGPDSRLLTLGWMDAAAGRDLRLHGGRVGSRVGRFSPLTDDPATSGPLLGVAARQSLQWGAAAITAEFDWLRVRAAGGERTERRLGAQISIPLGSFE
ncbi:hypothetical protein BURC_02824 [Burkholderiaceae bacterium]|nr:hypothetical protein BURC_02824 [Burkholderiaceae bacterium]